jgi:hypothetical protein
LELPVALLGAGLSRGANGGYIAAGFETPGRSYLGSGRIRRLPGMCLWRGRTRKPKIKFMIIPNVRVALRQPLACPWPPGPA